MRIEFQYIPEKLKNIKYDARTDWQKYLQGHQSQRMYPWTFRFHLIWAVQLKLALASSRIVFWGVSETSISTDCESPLFHPHPSLLTVMANYCAVASLTIHFLWSRGMYFWYNLLCVFISIKMTYPLKNTIMHS